MAKTIYVTSSRNFSGKTALCAGLIHRLQKDRLAIGYMKPVSIAAGSIGHTLRDEDAQFMKSRFGLVDDMDVMVPVVVTEQKVAAVLAGEECDLAAAVRSAFQTISEHKDLLVLEGGASLAEGSLVGLAPPEVSELLQAKELVVIPYGDDIQVVDDLIHARQRLGETLLGCVINVVPGHRRDFIESGVKPFVERRGIKIFGIIPREGVLQSVSVAELAEGVNGRVLCADQAMDELVEHLAVGAMSAESALAYFRRSPNKVVITGGDRPDIQLAAMETSTRCLILTGNIRPGPQIIARAEEKGIPIILTHHDTMSAINRIEGFFGKTRFHQAKKMQCFDELLEKYMDFKTLFRLIGL